MAPLTDAELERTYREGGWTIRQVVHHVPDSHMNAYVRTKLALTETAPAIKAYDEARWAELPDARSGAVGLSLDLLDSLHRRWVTCLRALSTEDFLRTYVHPELGAVHLYEALAIYAWHGRHHTAHIKNALSVTRRSPRTRPRAGPCRRAYSLPALKVFRSSSGIAPPVTCGSTPFHLSIVLF